MIWPFRKRPPPIRDRWDLSAPLFSINGRDTFTVGDACQGIQVFGSTGSGKSSAVVATIIRSYLSAGFGGLLLTTKPTDRDDYTRWCQETGRFDDLVIFSPTSDLRFNPIDAELRRQDAGAGLSENIVALLENITNIGERNQGQGGGQSYQYR